MELLLTMILTVMEFVMLMKFQAVLIFLMLNITQRQLTMMVLVQFYLPLDVLTKKHVILFPELQKMMVLVPTLKKIIWIVKEIVIMTQMVMKFVMN